MTESLSWGKLMLLLATGLAAVALLAAVSPGTSKAAEANFCWGVNLGAKPWLGYECTNSGAPNPSAVWGKGQSHSVCVGSGWNAEAWEGRVMCSGGPEQSVYNDTPTSYVAGAVPFIYNNANSATTAWGKFWY